MGSSAHNVTVVIPARDAAESVAAAVASARAQTAAPREILVVDDGSRDGTARALAAIAGDDLRVLTGPARGVAAARNLGLRTASTEWVGFLDADDRWMPTLLEDAISAVGSGGAVACFLSTEVVGDDGKPLGFHPIPDGPIHQEDLLLGRVAPTTSACVVRRRAALDIGGFFEGFERPAGAEDLDLWFRLTAAAPCVGVSTTSATYVVHEQRDRRRGHDELLELERDRELILTRLADQRVGGSAARRSCAVMRSRTARYWLLAGHAAEGRRVAWASVTSWPTLEGVLTLASACMPEGPRELARGLRRRLRARRATGDV